MSGFGAKPVRRAVVAGILAAAALGAAAGGALIYCAAPHKSYRVVAESMMPTLQKGDRIFARMGAPAEVRRGDVLLFRVGDSTYVQRVAGLPGDRIALRSGTVILNGRPVAQTLVGSEPLEQFGGPVQAMRLRERFPEEAGTHEIYDSGASEMDDVAERQVLPGHLFVLGDNRDLSADSRVPRSQMGVEQLPLSDVRGKARFFSWGSSRSFGAPVNAPE